MPESNDEPLFEARYLSEEEELSSVEEDDDTMSADSVEIVDHSKSSMMLPERLAESCSYVEQQCDMAVAVCMVSAGRAKVVSTSKPNIVSVPLTPALKRRPTIIRPPTSKLSRCTLWFCFPAVFDPGFAFTFIDNNVHTFEVQLLHVRILCVDLEFASITSQVLAPWPV
ncbi:hypothetical protein B0A49_09623 [Cryomyces minteri]|uniref:Uncharacterized protein n=1 Tax=Cryomyces minteri TaxID=331657 RepID=A0A4U0WQE1_9PEZI|nr:hypothetical protein B0A49_09623 [Cryomyces minteri]